MKIVLPEDVISPQDLRALGSELQDYSRQLRHQAVKQKVAGGRAGGGQAGASELSPGAATLLRSAGLAAAATPKQLEQLIAQLAAEEQRLPRIDITLAAPPSAGLKRTLTIWCRSHLQPNVLVSFHFNRTILGGMVVRSGSHIYDWSFRRQHPGSTR